MKKILIIAPAWIGDAIMAEPLYRGLHAHHSDLIVDVLAPSWTQAVHQRMSVVNEIITHPFSHGELRLLDRWKFSQEIKARQYNQAIVLPNSFKSALLPFLSGIPLRTGYVGEMRYGFLNDIRRLNAKALPRMVDRFVCLADPLYAPLSSAPHPQLIIDAENLETTVKHLKLNAQAPIIALCPGAEYGPAKRWPPRHAATLANALLLQGIQVWLFGSDKEVELADEIKRSAPRVINLCGKTQLGQAIDLLSLASAVMTNDSGLMHIAAALQRPLVAIYGSSSPLFTPPLSDNAQIVSLKLECSPCFKRTCPLLHTKCLNDLLPERVYTALQTLVPHLVTKHPWG